MNRDDVIRMAREAGFFEVISLSNLRLAVIEHLAQAAYAAGAAAENEACAKVCEAQAEPYAGFDRESFIGARALSDAASAIRARRNK